MRQWARQIGDLASGDCAAGDCPLTLPSTLVQWPIQRTMAGPSEHNGQQLSSHRKGRRNTIFSHDGACPSKAFHVLFVLLCFLPKAHIGIVQNGRFMLCQANWFESFGMKKQGNELVRKRGNEGNTHAFWTKTFFPLTLLNLLLNLAFAVVI